MKQSVYTEVVERDKGACVDCHKAGGLLHHVVPKSMLPGRRKPERDQPKNLVVLCYLCDQYAHTKVARKRHLTYLREEWGYQYDQMPWRGLLGEANEAQADVQSS